MSAFNPAIPVDGSVIDAGELRTQFGVLEAEIQMLDLRMEVQEQRGFGIDPLSVTITEPPTQEQVQAVVDKLNELIASMSR